MCKNFCVRKRLSVKSSLCEKLYEGYDTNYCFALVIFIVLMLLFSSAYNRRKFRSQTFDNWTDEKQRRAEAERRERLEERRSEKRKSQKKEDADARKGRGRKVGSLKRRVWSQLAR